MHTLELSKPEQETLLAALLSLNLVINDAKANANKHMLFSAVDVLSAQANQVAETIGIIYTAMDSQTGALDFGEDARNLFTNGLSNLMQRLAEARLLVSGIKKVDDLLCEQTADAARLAGRFYDLGK